jgi:hypothetical protein
MDKRKRRDNTMDKGIRTDNTMDKRRSTDNTIDKRRGKDSTIDKKRTDNTMDKRRTDNTMDKKNITQHIKLKIERILIKTGVLLKSEQLFLHKWHPSCYSYYKAGDQSSMK